MIDKTGTLTHNISEVGPSEGLLTWLPLNGNVLDYAGTNNGTNNGTTIAPGLNQSCYYFSSTNYITVPRVVTGSTFSASFWFKEYASADTTVRRLLLVSWNGFSFEYAANSLAPFFKTINSSSTERYAYSSTNCALDTWHHIVGVSTSSSVSIYLDGVLKATNSTAADVGWNNSNITLGYYSSSVKFNGYLQDVRIYQKALTAKEISTLYNLGLNRTQITKNTFYCKHYNEVENG